MFELLGICVALAALLALKVCASVLALAAWRALAPFAEGWSAAARARLLFTLRVLPFALAAACVFVLIVPAYLVHEPRDTEEVVGVKLLLPALASAAGLLFALKRLLGTWLATRRLKLDWLAHAEPCELEGAGARTYRVRHGFPVIAVVGVFRPRLFVAEKIFDALSEAELAAALAHERGHLRARDNLKRALLRASQDALLLPVLGRSLFATWRRASEDAADEFAASAGPEAALDLASALIKISRLIPPGARPTMPAGAHLLGEDTDVAQRVQRLLRLASREDGPLPSRGAGASRLLAWACVLALCTSGALAVSHPDSWKVTHAALEHVVEKLS